MHPLVELARCESIEAHNRVGQVRKGSGLPYWTHPEAVAAIVASVPHTPAMVAAAWLHDVVDDTGVLLNTIREKFGDDVARIVWTLSDQEKGLGNRRRRKEAECLRMSQAQADEQTVRLADILHNVQDVVDQDPAFAPVYLGEKARLHAVLTRGDAALFAKVQHALDRARAQLALRTGA